MTILPESVLIAKGGLQRTTVAALKKQLMAELQDLATQTGEITVRVRKIRLVGRGLKNGRDFDEAPRSSSCRLIRACRIALLESEKSQTVEQIQARIERRASFCFAAAENAASMIGRALAEMASVGEARCRNGFWERPTSPEAGVELGLIESVASEEACSILTN
jgi:hypothetical protein